MNKIKKLKWSKPFKVKQDDFLTDVIKDGETTKFIRVNDAKGEVLFPDVSSS